MYELKKIGKLFTSKFVGTGPSPYKKRIYRAAVSQSLRNTDVCVQSPAGQGPAHRTAPDLCKKCFVVLFGSNGNSNTVFTLSDMYIYVYTHVLHNIEALVG